MNGQSKIIRLIQKLDELTALMHKRESFFRKAVKITLFLGLSVGFSLGVLVKHFVG